MRTGRNDPCPCGSGKKYKKCCLAKDQEEVSRRAAAALPPPSLPDPGRERAEACWEEFESQDSGGRIALFLETLADAEVMTDDMAFEMLQVVHGDAAKSGDRMRFAECVGALRERRPEVFANSAPYYLHWSLVDALAEGRQELVPSLARELAGCAGRDIDTFNRAADALAYHGQLDVLVEALRIAWPLVESSDDVVPWGIPEFANQGADHEIFAYLERTASPDPADPALLDRVRFFVEEPREEYLREFIGDLMGTSGRQWQADDFARRPPRKRRKKSRGDRDEGTDNLFRLISEFVGYLRHEEGMPFPRGQLVRHSLYRYFVERDEGELDPRPSMLDRAQHPERKLPNPPPPVHLLCPERATLDVHLGGMMGMLNGLYYAAAALFQAIPAWLRFLESRRLIDAGTRSKVMAELLPLHATLLKFWEGYTQDPHLYRQGQEWPVAP